MVVHHIRQPAHNRRLPVAGLDDYIDVWKEEGGEEADDSLHDDDFEGQGDL